MIVFNSAHATRSRSGLEYRVAVEFHRCACDAVLPVTELPLCKLSFGVPTQTNKQANVRQRFLSPGTMGDIPSELKEPAEVVARPHRIADVLQLEESLASALAGDTLKIEAQKNLLNYWKTYFVGQYRYAYEYMYIGLEQSHLSQLLSLSSFSRAGGKPLQQRASGGVHDYIDDAVEAKRVLDGLVTDIQHERAGLVVQTADVKSATRAETKGKEDPDGLRALTDFARTSIIAPTADDLKYAHDWFVQGQHHQVSIHAEAS